MARHQNGHFTFIGTWRRGNRPIGGAPGASRFHASMLRPIGEHLFLIQFDLNG
jgi:hypothetical protein